LSKVEKVIVVVIVVVVVVVDSRSSSSNGGGRTGTAVSAQVRTGPYGFRRSRLQEFLDNWHIKVARLLVLRSGRLHPPGYPW
jgi:hypothetical protein